MNISVMWSRISSRTALLLVLATTAAIATACGSVASPTSTTPSDESPTAPQPSATATPDPTAVPTSTPDAESTKNLGLDVEAFKKLNPRPELRSVDRSIDFGFDEREVLPRDAINPVYSPKFVTPEEVEELMIENELVMGLNINGDARAYPVGIMRFREIVNDEVGGIPLLVSW